MVIQQLTEVELPTVKPMNPESNHSHFIHIKNHVREIRGNASQETNRLLRKRKKSISEDEISSSQENVETRESRDFDELRRVYWECKRVLQHIESEYGHRIGISVDKSEEKSIGSHKKRIIFDESGCGHEANCVPVGLPDDAAALSDMLRREDLKGSAREIVCDKLREVRARLTDEMRVNRRALQCRLREGVSTELAFIGSNLHTLPGYAVSVSSRGLSNET